MVRIDLLLFGYRRITVSETDVRIVAGLFLERGLSVKIVNNCFLIREDKYKKIEDLMKGRVEFSASRELGFGGFLRNNCRRVGVILAVITSLLINIILGGVVWDVRVEGVTESEEREIINELSDCGLRVGAVWSKIDMNALEVKMLSMSNTVSWINVNRRGSVAYVSVIGKIQGSEEENVFGYANIVAKCDGIIEDITVVKGVALVTRGQTVKKGDILISGVTPLGYCYAEGNVTARLTDCVSVEIKKRSVEISEKCRKRYSVALKILILVQIFINIVEILPKSMI